MRILLALLQTLKKHTSKDSPLSRQKIVEKLQEDYPEEQISPKQVRTRLDSICEMESSLPEEEKTVCYRVYSVKGKKTGEMQERKTDYYYNYPIFDYELKFIVDSVMSSMIFDSPTAQNLAKRIQNLSGKQLRDITPYANGSYGKQRFTLDTDVLENVKMIMQACKKNAFISFDWYVYDVVDHKVGVNYLGSRTLKPLKLIFNNGRYYLLGRFPDSEKVYTYSVDLMKKITLVQKVEETVNVKEKEKDIRRADYILEHPYNMGGEVNSYKLRVNREYLSRVVDTFSYKIEVIPWTETEETVDVRVSSSRMGMKYWLIHNYEVAELIDIRDQKLEEEIKEAVRILSERYLKKDNILQE